jgi:hypothetical protein
MPIFPSGVSLVEKGDFEVKAKSIDKVSEEVYRKHPDLKGVKPKLMPREGDKSNDTLLVYQKKVSGPGGKSINRIVRAVVDESGKIKKLSTSKG